MLFALASPLALLPAQPLLHTPPISQARLVSSPIRVADLQMAVDPDTAYVAVGALAAAGGAYLYTQQKAATEDVATSVSKSQPEPTAAAPSPPPSPTKKSSWGSLKRYPEKSLHRMAGRSVPPPKRELFVPPPGWVPPTKPVTSWYDMGLRLAPAAPAAVPKAVPVNPVQAFFNNLFSSGASSGSQAAPKPKGWGSLKRFPEKSLHRMAGRWEPPPMRELYDGPPPAVAPKPGAVASWYDSGKRL